MLISATNLFIVLIVTNYPFAKLQQKVWLDMLINVWYQIMSSLFQITKNTQKNHCVYMEKRRQKKVLIIINHELGE